MEHVEAEDEEYIPDIKFSLSATVKEPNEEPRLLKYSPLLPANHYKNKVARSGFELGTPYFQWRALCS
jgi:hypothetical protein